MKGNYFRTGFQLKTREKKSSKINTCWKTKMKISNKNLRTLLIFLMKSYAIVAKRGLMREFHIKLAS